MISIPRDLIRWHCKFDGYNNICLIYRCKIASLLHFVLSMFYGTHYQQFILHVYPPGGEGVWKNRCFFVIASHLWWPLWCCLWPVSLKHQAPSPPSLVWDEATESTINNLYILIVKKIAGIKFGLCPKSCLNSNTCICIKSSLNAFWQGMSNSSLYHNNTQTTNYLVYLHDV